MDTLVTSQYQPRLSSKRFCAFIDFEKAFDTVWRDGLWYKLFMCNIKDKMYNVILNLYNNIKSKIV
jgi:hypothetical protein